MPAGSCAVTERPHDASCLLALIVHYIKCCVMLLVASSSDFPLHTNSVILFSLLWSSLLAVINKDSLMHGSLCGKLHGGWSQLLFALQQSLIR